MSKEINLEGYRLAHTMIRVKDLEASFNFYCKTLGMKVLRKTDYPEGKFTNAFIGYGLETESPCLELTHNWDQKEDYDKETDGDMFVLKLQMFIKLVKILKNLV
jgi:lactoylglutathione lyase